MKHKVGVLINKDTLLQREYFKEFARLRGFESEYQYPLPESKRYSTQGEEIRANFSTPQPVWCILNDITDQKTARKLGWNAEQLDSLLLLSVPYDLPELQVGALFTVPSAVDDGDDRLFRVIEMSTVQIYPASITCRIAPEYETEVEKTEVRDFTTTTFNLLREG